MGRDFQLSILLLSGADRATLLTESLRSSGIDPLVRRVEQEEEFAAGLAEPPDLVILTGDNRDFGEEAALVLLRELCPILPAIVLADEIPGHALREARPPGSAVWLTYDELARLGPAVIRVCLEHQFEAERRRTTSVPRLEAEFPSMRRLVHELNNILAPVIMGASLLRLDLSPEERDKTLTTLEESAARGRELIRGLRALARSEEEAPAPSQAPPDAHDDDLVAGAFASDEGGETVLVVDDEPAVGRVMADLLRRAGYSVLLAASGSEALARLADHPGEIALVVTDLTMPGMSGISLLRQIREAHPHLAAIAMGGTTSEPLLRSLEQVGVRRIIQKPFGADVLLETVRAALRPNQ